MSRPDDAARLRRIAVGVITAVAALWLIHGLVRLVGVEPGVLGVHPRSPGGLVGILSAPLVHGSWAHLFGNTLPLLILATAMLYGTPRAGLPGLVAIWLGSGVLVWLFARDAAHIGASGVAYGMLFFVFVIGLLRRDRRSIALALLVFFLHGGMIWGVLPLAPGISFEYHLAGAVVGGLCAGWLRRRDPPAAARRYAWEHDEPVDEHGVALFFDDRPRKDQRR